MIQNTIDNSASPQLYIGVMSGTSLDGIDICAARMQPQIELVAADHYPLPQNLKNNLLDLIENPDCSNIKKIGSLDMAFGTCFADAINEFIANHKINRKQIHAIGSHGQTFWHQPTGAYPFSWQIGDPSTIAYKTQCNVIADFRNADIAAGGQGAPLVPAFHAQLFQDATQTRAIINIGGIANITVLPPKHSSQTITAFDTGPGNTLIDYHARIAGWGNFDAEGQSARKGTILPKLLDHFMSDPFFQMPPPKSTGREYFNMRWVTDQIGALHNFNPYDLQATLTEITAKNIAIAIQNWGHNPQEMIICGGGVHNKYLMERLRSLKPEITIVSSDHYGVSPDWIEALAFSWLAYRAIQGQPGTIPSATGALKPVITGALYQPPPSSFD